MSEDGDPQLELIRVGGSRSEKAPAIFIESERPRASPPFALVALAARVALVAPSCSSRSSRPCAPRAPLALPLPAPSRPRAPRGGATEPRRRGRRRRQQYHFDDYRDCGYCYNYGGDYHCGNNYDGEIETPLMRPEVELNTTDDDEPFHKQPTEGSAAERDLHSPRRFKRPLETASERISIG